MPENDTPTPESPMPAETTALDVLQRQVESLTAQLQTLTSERDEYRSAVNDLAAERDALKTAPEASARIAELEASIRDRNHFDKFAELAKGAKAKDKALKQLWRDAKDRGYQPESDEIDEKALQSRRGAIADRGRLRIRPRAQRHHHGRPGGCQAQGDLADQVWARHR